MILRDDINRDSHWRHGTLDSSKELYIGIQSDTDPTASTALARTLRVTAVQGQDLTRQVVDQTTTIPGGSGNLPGVEEGRAALVSPARIIYRPGRPMIRCSGLQYPHNPHSMSQ
ncbi:hypothetical protein PV11_05242 [Exophiala sideris]|uniref:Uncharacterized protein n=1 Tax=Exophiala sideris TaxID=1016849 RepID=A0A0D1YJY7_9EURO|nr:hypothetical protein PV11_05242 [Exophiala sideris]